MNATGFLIYLVAVPAVLVMLAWISDKVHDLLFGKDDMR